MKNVIILLLFGHLGYFLFRRLNLPAPVVLGPLFFSAAYSLLSGNPVVIPEYIPMFFIVGVAISVTQNVQLNLRNALKSLLVVIFFSVVLGLIVFKMMLQFGMAPHTAYFSSMPGGGTDLALISLNFADADAFSVVLFQTIRFFLVLLVYPIILRWLLRQKGNDNFFGRRMINDLYFLGDNGESAYCTSGPVLRRLPFPSNEALVAFVLISGLAIALILKSINFSGYSYVGGMLSTIIVGGVLKKRYKTKIIMDRTIATFFKVAACSLLGLQMRAESLMGLMEIWPALVLMNVVTIVGCLILGWFFYRMGWSDLVTAILQTAPGGSVPMAVLAQDFNGHVVCVSFFQVIRIIFIVLLATFLEPFIFS